MKRKRGRPTNIERVQRAVRQEQTDFLIGCSIEERSTCIKIVRLLRTGYWLSNFIEQLLHLDAETPHQVPISKVQDQLDKIGTVEDLIGRVQYIAKNERNWFRSLPIVRSVMEEWGDEIAAYKGDTSIRDLIESAKKNNGGKS